MTGVCVYDRCVCVAGVCVTGVCVFLYVCVTLRVCHVCMCVSDRCVCLCEYPVVADFGETH